MSLLDLCFSPTKRPSNNLVFSVHVLANNTCFLYYRVMNEVDKKSMYNPSYSDSKALVIGVSDYKYVSPLEFAHKDAEAIADILRSTFSFPNENVHVLLNEEASRENIYKSYLKYQKETNEDDRLIVFFAGHGHTEYGKRGEVGYLVPVDGKPDDISTLLRWDDFTRNADLIPAKHVFFIMDACYGGTALTRGVIPGGSMRWLKDMLQRYSRLVLTAGKADEVVADSGGPKPGHSIFTGHVLTALEGAAATPQGEISALGLSSYVYDKVGKDQYSSQTPHYGFLDGDGDFLFETNNLLSGEASDDDDKTGDDDVLITLTPNIETDLGVKPIDEVLKGLLSDPKDRIKLNDFLSAHTRRFLAHISDEHFPIQTPNPTEASFVDRLKKYEDVSSDLQTIVILMSRWADSEQLVQLENIFTRIAESDKGMSGKVLWLELGWYPVQLLMYSAGIAAISANRFDVLRSLFLTQVEQDAIHNNEQAPLVLPTGSHMSKISDHFKVIPGHEKQYVAMSEYLLKLLQPKLEDTLFLGRSYESLFDRYEVLQSLVFLDQNMRRRNWAPVGRFGWKYTSRISQTNPFEILVQEAKDLEDEWLPIKAGFFTGSYERFDQVASAFRDDILENLKKRWF